ncbi:hypothetical protein PORY_000986 [Pneumocystis oryctolagi]|uniref:Uncharacterized protein n=1 Tax=Pneumocystis oryctolagi TaxID=42067 RepID=A0ACB7CDG4_9ASCO|nr:hypothetical protein PORY_000986 [Pneumocystis oryctolagi]
MSELRVDVLFTDVYCFAGEPLSCIITFTKLDKYEKIKNLNKDARLDKDSLNNVKLSEVDQSSSFLTKSCENSVILMENKECLQNDKTNEPKESSFSLNKLGTDSIQKDMKNMKEIETIKGEKTYISHLSLKDSDIPHDSSIDDKLNEISVKSTQDMNLSQDELKSNVSQDINSRILQSSFKKEKNKETIMIGYVQVVGHFVLNEKIIKVEKFEELGINKNSVKFAKGSLANIHSQTTHKEGFVSNLGLFSNGLSNLFKNQSMSSLNEFKEIKDSKHIPILSTSPSILFVDLQLEPGESRSFGYKFTLPPQLPPTYDGKSIKISYHLCIGTQLSAKDIQRLEISKIPFEVLSKIDEKGEQIIYDLFSPISVFTDNSCIIAYEPSENISESSIKREKNNLYFPDEDDKCSKHDFVNYLLENLHNNSLKKLLLSNDANDIDACSSGTLGPTKNPLIKTRDIINNITKNNSLYSNLPNKKFNINKNGNVIGIVSILKSFYKLGETINGVIDFSSAKWPCYQIKFFLETTESVDPSVSICSKANISQTTRKIYDSYSENTLYAFRIQFRLTIPATAPPSFKTSAISLLWAIRLEITTPLIHKQPNQMEPSSLETSSVSKLLNENHRDYRGTHYFAASSLECEIFDCTIPIIIFPSLKTASALNTSNSSFYL